MIVIDLIIVGGLTSLVILGCIWWRTRNRETEYQRGWRNAREACADKGSDYAKRAYSASLYAENQTEFDDGWRDWIHSHYPNVID